jgi:hypothetical protein
VEAEAGCPEKGNASEGETGGRNALGKKCASRLRSAGAPRGLRICRGAVPLSAVDHPAIPPSRMTTTGIAATPAAARSCFVKSSES